MPQLKNNSRQHLQGPLALAWHLQCQLQPPLLFRQNANSIGLEAWTSGHFIQLATALCPVLPAWLFPVISKPEDFPEADRRSSRSCREIFVYSNVPKGVPQFTAQSCSTAGFWGLMHSSEKCSHSGLFRRMVVPESHAFSG